jgi:hypothetical protein
MSKKTQKKSCEGRDNKEDEEDEDDEDEEKDEDSSSFSSSSSSSSSSTEEEEAASPELLFSRRGPGQVESSALAHGHGFLALLISKCRCEARRSQGGMKTRAATTQSAEQCATSSGSADSEAFAKARRTVPP